MTVKKGVSFWVQSTIIPPPWPPPFNDLLRTGQKGTRGHVSVGACAYASACIRGCTHMPVPVCTHTYAYVYTCTRGGGSHLLALIFSQTLEKLFQKLLQKHLTKWRTCVMIQMSSGMAITLMTIVVPPVCWKTGTRAGWGSRFPFKKFATNTWHSGRPVVQYTRKGERRHPRIDTNSHGHGVPVVVSSCCYLL